MRQRRKRWSTSQRQSTPTTQPSSCVSIVLPQPHGTTERHGDQPVDQPDKHATGGPHAAGTSSVGEARHGVDLVDHYPAIVRNEDVYPGQTLAADRPRNVADGQLPDARQLVRPHLRRYVKINLLLGRYLASKS